MDIVGLQILLECRTSWESVERLYLHRVDHNVNDYRDHVHDQRSVLAQVRLAVVLLLVDVDRSQEHSQSPLGDLQAYGEGDEDQHEVVELVLISSLQDVLQLGRIGREQGNVQHALSDRLLGRISVGVDAFELQRKIIGILSCKD